MRWTSRDTMAPPPRPAADGPADRLDGAVSGLLDATSTGRLVAGLDLARDLVADAVTGAAQPYAGAPVARVREVVGAVDLDAPLGDTAAALNELREVYLDHAVWFHHPRYQAHLNCPVAVPAVVADLVASAVNTSVDTWDQSGAATLVEQRLVAWVADRIGFAGSPDGLFTSGGTQSNLHALLLAREAAERAGVPREQRCVVVSERAHFSVRRAAHLLGIHPDGREDGVLTVPTDDEGRMRPEVLARTLRSVALRGRRPVAVVATAGTTDHGAVDPLREAAGLARAHGTWLHVDAAYGGGLLLSPTRRHLLDGLELADSVTVDFHKTWFQPVACSALLVRDRDSLALGRHHADYLNPARGDGPDHDEAPPNLVDHSLQTTRRFDALKLWLTLRVLGADHLGRLLDRVCDVAAATRAELVDDADLDVVDGTDLSTVLLRWTACPDDLADDVNDAVRARLVADGTASVARTRLDGRTWLKLTLLDPATTVEDTREVVDLVRSLAREETAARTLEAAR